MSYEIPIICYRKIALSYTFIFDEQIDTYQYVQDRSKRKYGLEENRFKMNNRVDRSIYNPFRTKRLCLLGGSIVDLQC